MLNSLKTLPEGKRVIIPCIYNSGRKAYVRATVDHPEIIHIEITTDRDRPYQNIPDGYLHLDVEAIDEKANCTLEGVIGDLWRKEAADIIEAVKGINKHFFAGTLTVISDSGMIASRTIASDRYEVVVPLTDAHLGGSWQRYYQDHSWMDEAAEIKGGTIYYA